MLIRSRPNLHYPITVSAIKAQRDSQIKRFGELFSYKYKTTVVEENKYGETNKVVQDLLAGFESQTEGKVLRWFIEKGDVITGPGVNLVEIEEPCRHEVQWGGLCVACGEDMDNVSFAQDVPDSQRATVGMAHGHADLKVSKDVAARADDESKRRLLASEKLSLVVDLDQTIIQATVDPTVADWQKDTNNPNHDAVKNVRAFQLFDEGSGRYTWYYIKFRPGLEEFLKNISVLYELHVYTMGTRAYAEHIAELVDPDRHIFGDRILSRNESGSEREKKLERLFPVDTKMVVIIDDRGDVWNWSPNLVKVKPYDFFVGIGDINSSFLPKRSEPPPPPPPEPTKNSTPETSDEPNDESGKKPEVVPDPVPAAPGTAVQASLASLAGGQSPETLQDQTSQQDEALAAQIEERPLLQKQLQLDKADEAAANEDTTEGSSTQATEHPRHNLLHDDDNVLEELETSLRQIHRTFYEEYHARLATAKKGSRVNELKTEQYKRSSSFKAPPINPIELLPDVGEIIPPMKNQVLSGVNLVFTGVIPLGQDITQTDIGRWVQSFGARISHRLTKRTTHVIASRNRRTAKVRQAAHHSWIKIVSLDWLYESISQWSKLDESMFEIPVEPDGPALPGVDEALEPPGILSDTDDEDGSERGTETNSSALDDEEDPNAAIPKDADWDDMDKELEEFMNETDNDGDNTTDGDDDTGSDEGSQTGSGAAPNGEDADATTADGAVKQLPRKRKRTRIKGDTVVNEDDGDDSDASTGSRLQKRRKKALERTTSLSTVVPAPGDKASSLPSPDSTGPEEGVKAVSIAGGLKPGEDATKIGERLEGDHEEGAGDDGDVDGDDLEADLMAAFEDGDEDE